MHYNNGTDHTLTMSNLVGNVYSAIIPAQSSSGTIIYHITATDNADNSATSSEYTITVKDLMLDLSEGWNLVSVPKTLTDNVRDNVFSGDTVWLYNATIGGWVEPTTIDTGYGYWVSPDVAEDIGLNYEDSCTGPGCGPSETIYLQPAWNLIGHMCTTTQGVETAFPSSIYKNLFVLRYDKDTDSFEIYATQDTGNAEFDQMTPGEGYWVFVVSDNGLPYTNIC